MMHRFTLILALVFSFVASWAYGASTETVGMHAPPAPGRVVVDGKLDDWDLSGSRLMCYDVAAMKDRLSGTVAFMSPSCGTRTTTTPRSIGAIPAR
jgi:hypothetical protein